MVIKLKQSEIDAKAETKASKHIKENKFLTDFLPLILFFAAYKYYGIMEATLVLVLSTICVLTYCYIKNGKIAPLPLFTAIIVGIFGGLTIISNDDIFIKLKPTIINIIFASILLFGCIRGKGFLKNVMGSALEMPDAAWVKLSFRWAMFFLFLAGLNEVVWRNFSTDIWVDFKVFGILALSLLFMISQVPFLRKYAIM